MKKLLYPLILPACVIITSSFLFIKNKELRKLEQDYQELLHSPAGNLASAPDVSTEYGLLAIDLVGTDLSNQIDIQDDKKPYSLTNIIGDNQHLLVFSFSHRHCDPCVDSVLRILAAYDANIALFGDFSNPRELHTFQQSKRIDLPLFNVKYLTKKILDAPDIPFLYILDKNNKIREAFYPYKENNERTIKHIRKLLEKYS